MGTSTDANIGFGIVFEEGFEFPWYNDDEIDYDYEEWWKEINSYENPFDWQNESDKYFQFKRDWEEKKPIPFQLENCCSADYPIYVLCCRDTVKCASRGDPTVINPNDLSVNNDKLNLFNEFLEKYNLGINDPKWLLFSYWG